MHAQIKTIIASIRTIPGARVLINFTSGESTLMGRILYEMYYKTELMDMLRQNEHYGYPHNGGQHTFQLACKAIDAIAFVEQLKETMEARQFFSEELRQVISELSFISQELYAFR